VTSVAALLHSANDLMLENPRRDAEILLCHCLSKDRAWLYTWPEAQVAQVQARQFSDMLQARSRGTPIAYLTGSREFWSLELEVNQHTLIPRAETETLVEWALELSIAPDARVLDLGTGSGAIALALASERPDWHVSGVDVSAAALGVAARNRATLKLENISFHVSNWYGAVIGQYHLLVSNPPYIEQSDVHLSQGDLPHEPQLALVAAQNGLADLSTIIEHAPAHLHQGGWLLLEHGFEQGEAVRQIFRERGFGQVETRLDLAGCQRITGGMRPC
jgi:release factor glutamine methyltransferase